MYTEYREWPRSSPPIAFAIAIGIGVAIAWIANTSTKNETDIAFKNGSNSVYVPNFSCCSPSAFLFCIFSALYLIIQVKLNSNISFIVFLFAWQCVQDVGENRKREIIENYSLYSTLMQKLSESFYCSLSTIFFFRFVFYIFYVFWWAFLLFCISFYCLCWWWYICYSRVTNAFENIVCNDS